MQISLLRVIQRNQFWAKFLFLINSSSHASSVHAPIQKFDQISQAELFGKIYLITLDYLIFESNIKLQKMLKYFSRVFNQIYNRFYFHKLVMEIIKRYKAEVDTAFDQLHQDKILTQQQSKFHRESFPQQSLQNSIISQQSHLQQNPYKKSYSQFIKFDRISKCSVCKKQGKYRCPQCLISYCSGQHYKCHNLFCSERFFKLQVQNKLKSMKSNKSQKLKAIAMLKQHNQLQGKNTEDKLKEFSEQRLLQLLEKIQQFQQDSRQQNFDFKLILTQEEQLMFNDYVQNIQISSAKLNQSHSNKKQASQDNQHNCIFEKIQSYWEISDGLDYYFMQELQVQQFSESKYPEIIIYRQLSSKKFRQNIKQLSQLTNHIRGNNLPEHFKQEVLQYMLIFVLLNQAYNNDLISNSDQVLNMFYFLFQQGLCNNIAERFQNDEFKSKQGSKYAFSKLKLRISQIIDPQIKSILTQWYQADLINSCKIIVKNKCLLVQTFLRLLEFFEKKYQIISQLIKDQRNKLKLNQNGKSNQNIIKSSKNQQICIHKIKSRENQQSHIHLNDKNKKSNQIKTMPGQISKRKLNQIMRHIKKIQLMLAFIKDQMRMNEVSKEVRVRTYFKAQNIFRYLHRCLLEQEIVVTEQMNRNKELKQIRQTSLEIAQNGIAISSSNKR